MLHLPLTLLCFLLCSRVKAGEIIGGMECRPHSRPYMAYLTIVTECGQIAACGGFLIRRDFVLTAAHCAGRSISVSLGVHNISKKEDTWQVLKVQKQFPHPKYDERTVHHDIMLLKLEEKARLTLAVGTVPLASRFDYVLPGRMCRVAGWGKTEVTGRGSDTLQEVKQRLVEPQECRYHQNFNHKIQLCVGSSRKRKSAFKGDSGGPLLCAGVAHGIVSYGKIDAKPPTVFTRISNYRTWINRILKEN